MDNLSSRPSALGQSESTVGTAQIAVLLIIASLIVLSTPAHAEPPDNYPFIKYDAGLKQSQSDHKKIFVYFGRFGCGFCDMTNKQTFSDKALRERFIQHYTLVYADAESGDRINLPSGERITEMELGARLNVYATPVFIYLEPDGTMIYKAPGFKTVKEFIELDGYIHGNHYKTQTLAEYLAAQK
jgi:thioredoxin-related protein